MVCGRLRVHQVGEVSLRAFDVAAGWYALSRTATAAALTAATVSGCTSASSSTPQESPILARTPSATETPSMLTADGAPAIAEFTAPNTFHCLAATTAHNRQAQISVGWSVPSATNLVVTLDGMAVHAGIRDTVPFHVPAGSPAGIGTTVVFACGPATQHTLTFTWQADGSPVTERILPITKAADS